jgi:rsbT antagonist protein RsbS
MARVPVIQIGGTLIATVLEELRDSDALDLQQELGALLERTGARGVLLDLTVVETVDSFLGRLFHDVAVMAGLLGGMTIVVGIQPAVAMTLVELGLELQGVRTALTVEKGLVILGRQIAVQDRRGRHAHH